MIQYGFKNLSLASHTKKNISTAGHTVRFFSAYARFSNQMIPNIKFMEDTFLRFRESIFACPLPIPRFEVTRAATFRGKFAYRRVWGKICDPVIRLSLNFNLPAREWEDVLIHEMIHYVIALRGVRETSHGPTFQSMMKQINSDFGRDIRISHRAQYPGVATRSASEAPSTTTNYAEPLRRHYVCVVRLSDCKMGLFRAAASRLFKVWNHPRQYPQVTDWRWIGTHDPTFKRIPKSLKGALYIIEDYKSWLHAFKYAVTLEHRGDRIIPMTPEKNDIEEWLSTNFPD